MEDVNQKLLEAVEGIRKELTSIHTIAEWILILILLPLLLGLIVGLNYIIH